MTQSIRDITQLACEAAEAQRQFEVARTYAQRWLEDTAGEPAGLVLLAATLLQAVAGNEIGQRTGQTHGEVISALGADMRQLANIVMGNNHDAA